MHQSLEDLSFGIQIDVATKDGNVTTSIKGVQARLKTFRWEIRCRFDCWELVSMENRITNNITVTRICPGFHFLVSLFENGSPVTCKEFCQPLRYS